MTDGAARASDGSPFDYDVAWDMRLALTQEWIAAGACDSHRLLAALQHQERHFELIVDGRGGGRWQRRTVEAGTATWPWGGRLMRPTSVKGEFVKVPSYAEFAPAPLLADLARHFGPFDAIVELGCGHGRNLFELYDQLYEWGDVRYVGGEIAPAGIALAALLGRYHPAPDRFSFAAFDHTRPDMALIPPGSRRVLILTVHSIEQVRRLPLDYFHTLAGAAPTVVGVHIEPFGFQVDAALGPATREQAQFFAGRRWNTNFMHALRRAEADGAITVVTREQECFLPIDPVNPGSLAIWRRG